MAKPLSAAMLCGALLVCCTPLAQTADTPPVPAKSSSVPAKTSSNNADTPSVLANTLSVTADTPLVNADTPSVTAKTFSNTADTPSVPADTPSVTADTPSMAADTPSVTADTPSVTADTPSVLAKTSSNTADTPSGTANTPLETANTSSVTADTSSVTADTPPETANTSSVTANTPLETANTSSVIANTSSETANTSSETANTSSVTANTSSETANTSSVTVHTATVTADTSSVTANTSSETANTSSVTVHTATVTADTSPETDNTSAVTVHTATVTADTSPETANTSSVTVHTATVTADTSSETANTSSVTVHTATVTADTPLETDNTSTVTGATSSATSELPLPGQTTYVEGGSFVFAADEDFLAECELQRRSQDMGYYTLLDSVNNKSSADFQRGTLKIDYRLDNVTWAAQSQDAKTKVCWLEIKARSSNSRRRSVEERDECHGSERKESRWLKMASFKSSPDGDLTVAVPPKHWYFRDSLERPSFISYLFSDLKLWLQWTRLPQFFSMELQYTLLECQNDLFLNVTMTSPYQGVLKTPFWDGVSVYTEDFMFNGHRPHSLKYGKYGSSNGTVITVPHGYRAMISWEHVGLGESSDCDSFKVHVGEWDPQQYYYEDALYSAYCGAASPDAMLVAWRNIHVSIEAPLQYLKDDIRPSRVVFTGISMRFSFHENHTSALPQQLAEETWNCSVAHWPDFKRHLLCDLLTDCAGGEDEADCSYTNRGTCRHGDLAAGGSCFTFDRTPEALTSWTEAEATCRRRGARLPTLNTPAKWRAVVDLLSHRGWENIYIGLSSGDPSLPDLYSHFLRWADSSVAYYLNEVVLSASICRTCAFLKRARRPGALYMDSCFQKVVGNLLCEVEGHNDLSAIAFPTEDTPPDQINSTRCPKGHVTHNFLSCDPRSDCLTGCYTPFSAPLSSLPPAFKCLNGFERVPFTLVCDHRGDCSDASDEICVFPPCLEWECNNKQCIARHKMYDGVKDCLDGSDETAYSKKTLQSRLFIRNGKPLPAMALHDGKGWYDLLDVADPSLQSTSSDVGSTVGGCPNSHFQCPGVSYYCLPVYARCNGVRDCPGHQDEADCDNFRCPGFYRCLDSKVCLHDDQLCDDIFQCPQRDDELMCGFVCPVNCTCYGLAFYCTVPFDASRHAGLRFLDASGSGMGLKGLTINTMLFHLSLAKCNITQLENMNFVNVFHLDLSENFITTLTERHIGSCQNLQVFVLAGNPLSKILEEFGQGASFAKMHSLDLSAVSITAAQVGNLRVFPNISTLNLSNTRLDIVLGFSDFRKLRVLDLRGCPVTYFTRSIFQGLDDLSTVYADNYKLCCPETLPDVVNVLNCHAPFDEVSSCEGLLKSELYRVSLSVLTSMILLGNAGSFVYRVFINTEKKTSSFCLFVTNLCASDFLMGLYSAIIGLADRIYLGNYVWNDVTWRRGVTCKIAGVLSLMSNEVSVLIVCLITVDRFLVTRFPFSRQLHFSLRSARVACVTAWSVGLLLAATPLLPVTSHWQLYSQTGICIPLPVTRVWFAGKQYSFGILIILNFVLFLVIASGQLSIYLSIRANSMITSDSTQKAKDITIARRLITVAVSDFMCWFPVGLLGILSSSGQPIPGEVSVVIAVFVLPLNSALNPFLYTVNVILERRQRTREQRLLEMILSRHSAATTQEEGERSAGPV